MRGQKSRHRHPVSPEQRPQLPPYREQPLNQRTASPQTLSTSQPPPPSSVEQSSHPSSPPEQPTSRPNAAANRAPNPSRFKVLLSDYNYSPSSAVQNLSHQLSRPISQSAPIPPTPNPGLDTGNTNTHQDQTKPTSPPLAHPTEHKKEPISQTEETPLNLSSIDSKLQPRRKTTSTETQQPHSTLLADVSQLSTEQIPQPAHHTPLPIPKTPAIETGVVIKQGVVKLLFKLKKNNHHGYIAPNDGSKDIIFHKKYIGDDVFSQLERGMAVEVTAHITEGKAYADQIRIL
ncbi:dna-binding protein with cold shock-like domain protein [Leptolyngbya sp. Heron Island J]|nr:dna-binding protein with cold shock-like domain protein [Leptolyngbya sp. Heron Island J]